MAVKEPASDQDLRSCLLIYDGRCRLCVTAKQGLEQLGARHNEIPVRMITYQGQEARDILGHRYQAGRPDVAFLVAANGEIAEGLDAFIPLLPGLKGGRFFARCFSLPGTKFLGKFVYRLVARYRYRLFGEVPLEGCPSLSETSSGRHTKFPS